MLPADGDLVILKLADGRELPAVWYQPTGCFWADGVAIYPREVTAWRPDAGGETRSRTD